MASQIVRDDGSLAVRPLSELRRESRALLEELLLQRLILGHVETDLLLRLDDVQQAIQTHPYRLVV